MLIVEDHKNDAKVNFVEEQDCRLIKESFQLIPFLWKICRDYDSTFLNSEDAFL